MSSLPVPVLVDAPRGRVPNVGRRDGSFGYTAAFIALVAGLGIAGSLVYLLVARPVVDEAGVEITGPEAEDCPVGERAPVCYRFEVTNTGDEVGSFNCQALPPADSLAVFSNGEPRSALVLGPGRSETVTIKVTPLETDTVSAPSLTCDPPG
jgi:hypothetical protein